MVSFFYYLHVIGRSEVKCFSLVEEVGNSYSLNAYYFINLRSNYSSIYVRGRLNFNGNSMTINRRLLFINKYNDGKHIILKMDHIKSNFGDTFNFDGLNSFIPLSNSPHEDKLAFDFYKQLDGSFIFQKENGNMIYCNI